MSNHRGFFGFMALISGTIEAWIVGIYLSNHNLLGDIIWALPLATFFGLLSLFALDYYYYLREHIDIPSTIKRNAKRKG